MSEVKVNKISPRTNCGTVTLGDSGDSFVIPAGATITNNGTQTGFGRTGTVDWDTTAKTASFTAVSGNGYFVNTTSGAVTMTLPATPSAGDIVAVSDYAGTSAANAITIARNGSPIEGGTDDASINAARESKTFVYVDGTQGWLVVNSNDESAIPSPFIIATGGIITCCGDYKIHTFTGPGTFTVSNSAIAPENNEVSYMVVAGGGAGGKDYPAGTGGGGGGAGGFREYKGPADCYTASPLNGNPGGTSVTVTTQAYPITVGAGGATVPAGPGTTVNPGSNSLFSTVTSAGGGGGSNNCNTTANPATNLSGGSGGGNTYYDARPCAPQSGGGAGNTPPTTPPQGNNGGNGSPSNTNGYRSGGGGGATAAGVNGNGPSPTAGDGGAGAITSIAGAPNGYAGGGGGGFWGPTGPYPTGGSGGTGGGGPAGPTPNSAGIAGTANTGGGGGGGTGANPVSSNASGGAGGSGIVIIRYKYQ